MGGDDTDITRVPYQLALLWNGKYKYNLIFHIFHIFLIYPKKKKKKHRGLL